MNRGDFKNLAEMRLREADALLRARHFSGAYYLGGYAVECALKACIAKKTRRYDFPESPNRVKECYTHDIEKLVIITGLKTELDKRKSADPEFKTSWLIALKWSAERRYEIISKQDAQALLEAIGDPNHGVLRWIRSLW
jgi:HEPN domain-containing protein